MGEMEKFCRIVEDELKKISEKGLNTANIDTAYKLVDMYKDLKNTEYWEMKSEYYMSMMDGGYSQNHGYDMDDYSQRRGRKRDSRGRYSRADGYSGNNYEHGDSYARRGGRMYSRGNSYADGYSGYDRYMDSKESYRSNKSPECKERLMNTLEEYMEDFSNQMEEMMRDSDCQEERATIKRYIDKIKNIA